MYKYKRNYEFLGSYLSAYIFSEQESNFNFTNSVMKRNKILIIEDDEPILESLLTELLDRGFQARGLTTPEKIFKEMSQFKPDVLLVDYYIPLGNGIEINKNLIDNNYLENTLFILMSAYSHIKDMVKKNNILYLEKPFSVDELINLINNSGGARNTLQNSNNTSETKKEDSAKKSRKHFLSGFLPLKAPTS